VATSSDASCVSEQVDRADLVCPGSDSTLYTMTSCSPAARSVVWDGDFLRMRDTSPALDVGHTARRVQSVRGTCFVFIISRSLKVQSHGQLFVLFTQRIKVPMLIDDTFLLNY
jgi:hypothetical protein